MPKGQKMQCHQYAPAAARQHPPPVLIERRLLPGHYALALACHPMNVHSYSIRLWNAT
jgi:hypothetical protein